MKRLMNHQGFSLIELMVAIAIAAIVTSIAIPAYLSWKPRTQLRGAVFQVQSDLNRAKMRATETRRQCRVVFSSNGYQIFDGNRIMNSNQWGSIDGNGVFTNLNPAVIKDLTDFPRVTILTGTGAAIAAGAEPTITFSPRGTAINNSIQLSHPDAKGATIAVNITSRINITWL
jgi:prepilin-type N-terminal cleavage/methylation domain-containing protein